MDSFGQYLKNLRERRGLTPVQVERKVNLKKSYLYQIEQKYKGVPCLRVLVELAKAYDVLVYVLVYRAIETLKAEDKNF